jgi:hypothetical protein
MAALVALAVVLVATQPKLVVLLLLVKVSLVATPQVFFLVLVVVVQARLVLMPLTVALMELVAMDWHQPLLVHPSITLEVVAVAQTLVLVVVLWAVLVVADEAVQTARPTLIQLLEQLTLVAEVVAHEITHLALKVVTVALAL